jgi:hypothetical protein
MKAEVRWPSELILLGLKEVMTNLGFEARDSEDYKSLTYDQLDANGSKVL